MHSGATVCTVDCDMQSSTLTWSPDCLFVAVWAANVVNRVQVYGCDTGKLLCTCHVPELLFVIWEGSGCRLVVFQQQVFIHVIDFACSSTPTEHHAAS